jgi:regulator of sirC expression with transglutaminase-like and TPR domain
MSEENPSTYLSKLAASGNGPHDIARAALMLSALDHRGQALAPYFDHLEEIASVARDAARQLRHLEEITRTLASVMTVRFGYDGDRVSYDDPRNADLMSVIDRRRGLPVALGILYLHAARAAGCLASGLNTPGHFFLGLELEAHHMLVDPFNGGAALDIDKLYSQPEMHGRAAPGEPSAPEAVSDTDVLLRLQNNLKLRALQLHERDRAIELAKRMVLIAPGRAELWFDLARLSEDSEALGAAREAYETVLEFAKAGQPLHNEAALALASLKRRLN